MKKAKKVLALFLVTLMIITTFQSSVQAASKKADVQKSVTDLFSQIQTSNQSGMNKYIKNWGSYKLSNFYTLSKSYFKTSAKKLTYSVEKITVKGNTATVKISVKYVNSQEIYNDALTKILFLALTQPNISEENLNKSTNNIIKTSAKQHKIKYRKENISLVLSKSGNKWVLKKENKKLTNIILSNWIYATDHNGFH